jgi:biopolymer transport protein ExbD
MLSPVVWVAFCALWVVFDIYTSVDWLLTLGCLLCFAAGFFLLLNAAAIRRDEENAEFLMAHSLTQPGSNAVPQRKSPFVVKFSAKPYGPRPQTGVHGPLHPRLPTTSLVTLLVLELVAIPVWLDYVLTHRPPIGIRIRLLRSEYASQPSPGIQPVLIHIDRDHSLSVNGKAVSTDDFESALRSELPLRPTSWPVYLEGDCDLEWQYAFRVIEAVQPYGRNVVLLKSRQPSSSGAK